MRAMLWKELRENFKWAVLAMIGLGMAEFYGLTVQSQMYYYDQGTLCKSSYLMATTFGCAAVGLVLGLIQILPEQRRDQWAALLHRPVQRSTIYCGKALAGFLLYLFATIPPFLATFWYASTPGHFSSPVVSQMLWPGIADTCAGTMYYFAALFVGLRRGAWYGTRAFGFLAAVWVSFFVTEIYYQVPRVPIEAALLMSLTLFVAGWGAIMSNGKLGDQLWLTRLAVVVVIFYGVCTMGTLIMLGMSMFAAREYYYGIQYEVDIDGRPIIFDRSGKGGTVTKDLAGKVIEDKRFKTGNSYNYILGFNQVSTYIGDPHGLTERKSEYSYGYRNNQSFLVPAMGSYDSEAERWYYLPIQKQFVGYYFRTNQRIGAIGADGFKPGDEVVKPLVDFKSRDYGQIESINQMGQGVYKSEFDQRKLTPIFSQPGETLYGATGMGSNQLQNLDWAAAALKDKVVVVETKTGKTVAVLPYHQNMDRWGSLQVAVMPSKDKFFIRYQQSQWIGYLEMLKMPQYLEEMDTQGNLLATYTLPPFKPEEGVRTWQQYIVGSLRSPFIYLWNLSYIKIGAACGSERLAASASYTFGWNWPDTRETIGRTNVASLVFALATFFWARRVGLSKKRVWLWTVFVWCFNLAGLITFRLVADWPVRVKCPACGQKREIETATCPHCHAGWPVAQPNGMEIFEEKIPAAQLVS